MNEQNTFNAIAVLNQLVVNEKITDKVKAEALEKISELIKNIKV